MVSNSATNPTAFLNYAYTGSNADGGGTSLDRTREGYVEIIEMGSILGNSNTEDAVTHIAGVPPCDDFSSASTDTIYNAATAGGLFGTMTLINVLAGQDVGTDATALEGFSQTSLWSPPDSLLPTLANVNPKVSVVTTGTNTYVTDWTATLDAVNPVSAVLMHNNVYNEFVLDKATASKTDWVVTMPTKTYYYSGVSDKELKVIKLFQRNFKSIGACDDVSIVRYDREERTVKTPGSFSPPAPTVKDSLCWEANVITFNGGNVFASKNVANLTTTFENGWASISFPTVASSIGPIPYSAAAHQLGGSLTTVVQLLNGATSFVPAATYFGLPVIGFAAWTFSNGNVGGVLSNYGGAYIHKYTRHVEFGSMF